jgi:hypothetical protein
MAASDRKVIVKYNGGDAISMKLGNRDLSPMLRSADIYFRAGQTPEVILRPVVTEWLTDLEGPTLTIAPDVGIILEAAGWGSPETMATLEEALAEARSRVEDLELANRGLHDELEDALRDSPEGDSTKIHMDITR